MRRRVFFCAGVAGLILVKTFSPAASRAGVLDKLWESGPPTLADVARMIDRIQNEILNQGTVVVKQPDVWSQARMTKFRKEFEDTMLPEVNQFTNYLSAQIARSDSAGLQSQTSLGAVLNPFAPGMNPTQISTNDQLTSALSATSGLTVDPKTGQVTGLPTAPSASTTTSTFTLLNQAASGLAAPGTTPQAFSGLKPGIEPNVHLDEKSDYLTHLHRIRRVNLGDDNSDSAGYGLYLMRVPVSIQPGDRTKKGFGAIVNMTMRHDFGPRFLPLTYRNLVINDLIDILAPNLFELIRNGKAEAYHNEIETFLDAKGKGGGRGMTNPDSKYVKNFKNLSVYQPVSRTGSRTFAIAPTDVKRVFVEQNLLNLAYAAQESLDLGNPDNPTKFPGHQTNRIRADDVRTFLRHELEAAYDLMEGRCHDPQNPQQMAILNDTAYIDDLANQVYCRKYEGPKGARVDDPNEERNEFYNLYESFTHRIPGNLRFRPVGILAWGIAIEAGMLNRQLQEDMKEVKGADGYLAPREVENMQFYVTEPGPEVVTAFHDYIKARWPMITFALEPFTDQQNIEDSFTRRRDLQLAISFALSSGRMSFRQAIQYTRQLQYEAQTIALNQTVTSFAHGNDTFGWRFSPRYQTPPEESNLRTVTNLLINGGPGPNFGLKNSKIEPGMRELTAVVVMPSFVRGMRLDVSSDWFRLHDPDERKLHTAHTIELGRKINEARTALEVACKCGQYRYEDIERLRNRLHQLEVMLPLQTQFVKVPYENTLGGFALFTQGTTALVPELVGYEGVEFLDTTKATDLLVFGKHFSIYENAVLVGGQNLIREGTSTQLVAAQGTTGNPVLVPTTVTPVIDTTTGNVTVLGADGKTATAIKNPGTFDVLSREVMRVHIPAGVYTSMREDGTQVVEVYVSTPNGISNRLQIPVKPKPTPNPGGGAKSGQAFTFIGGGGGNLTVRVNATLAGANGATATYGDAVPFPKDTKLEIQATGGQPLPPTISLSVAFSLATPTGGVTQLIPIKDIPLSGDTYVATPDQLNPFAQQLVNLFKGNSLNFIDLPSQSIQVQPAPIDPNGVIPDPASMTNAMTVKFQIIVGPNPPAAANWTTPKAITGSVDKSLDPMTWQTSITAPKLLAGGTLLDPTTTDPAVSPAQFQVPGAIPPQAANLLSRAPTLPTGGLGLTFTPTTGTGGFTITPASGPAPTPAPTPTPAPAPATPTTVVMPSPPVVVLPSSTRSPSINISVPVTNNMPSRFRGLLHRKDSKSPASQSARGPLMERLMGRP